MSQATKKTMAVQKSIRRNCPKDNRITVNRMEIRAVLELNENCTSIVPPPLPDNGVEELGTPRKYEEAVGTPKRVLTYNRLTP